MQRDITIAMTSLRQEQTVYCLWRH